MITEIVAQMCANLIYGLFASFDLMTLPVHMVETLHTITSYGVYVVGLDVMAIFTASVGFWWTTNATIGIFVWVYEKIPFT